MSGVGLNNSKSAVVYRNWNYTRSYSICAVLHCFQSRHALVAAHVFTQSSFSERQIGRQSPSCKESSCISRRSAPKLGLKWMRGLESTTVQRSPLSGDSLHNFKAAQHAGLPLPHAAETLEVLAARKDVELDHAEHPVVVLNQSTEPEGRRTLKCGQVRRYYCLDQILISVRYQPPQKN